MYVVNRVLVLTPTGWQVDLPVTTSVNKLLMYKQCLVELDDADNTVVVLDLEVGNVTNTDIPVSTLFSNKASLISDPIVIDVDEFLKDVSLIKYSEIYETDFKLERGYAVGELETKPAGFKPDLLLSHKSGQVNSSSYSDQVIPMVNGRLLAPKITGKDLHFLDGQRLLELSDETNVGLLDFRDVGGYDQSTILEEDIESVEDLGDNKYRVSVEMKRPFPINYPENIMVSIAGFLEAYPVSQVDYMYESGHYLGMYTSGNYTSGVNVAGFNEQTGYGASLTFHHNGYSPGGSRNTIGMERAILASNTNGVRVRVDSEWIGNDVTISRTQALDYGGRFPTEEEIRNGFERSGEVPTNYFDIFKCRFSFIVDAQRAVLLEQGIPATELDWIEPIQLNGTGYDLTTFDATKYVTTTGSQVIAVRGNRLMRRQEPLTRTMVKDQYTFYRVPQGVYVNSVGTIGHYRISNYRRNAVALHCSKTPYGGDWSGTVPAGLTDNMASGQATWNPDEQPIGYIRDWYSHNQF